MSSIICKILSHSHGLTSSLHRNPTYPQDDEENLGLLFWDELPPGHNTATLPSTSGVDGGMGGAGLSGEADGPEEDNEIPVIDPSDQSAEYTGEMFGMQQNSIHESNSYAAGHPPLCELGDSGGGVRRTSPESTFVNIITKSIPNVVLQSRDENTPRGGAPPMNNTMGCAAALPTTIRGAELSAHFPPPSCGSVPTLLKVQELSLIHI